MDGNAQSLEEIKEIRREKKVIPLTKFEMKLFRKYVGKLNWLAENTRPDLSVWALNPSKSNANATVGDLKTSLGSNKLRYSLNHDYNVFSLI